MKKLSTLLLSFCMMIVFFSCDTNAGNMEYIGQMKDSIFAVYPKINSVLINVKDDKQLIITLGSQSLFNADEQTRQRVANEMGAMALRIFGEGNRLALGKISVTADESNQKPEPEGALETKIDFLTIRQNKQ